MFWFVVKRVCFFLVSLCVVVTITFFLAHGLSGDPFIGDEALNPETLCSLRTYYGLDRSLGEQYGSYLQKVLRLDLGSSILYQGQSVISLIGQRLPISAFLGGQALILACVGGIALGSFIALKEGGWLGKCASYGSFLGLSIPVFVLASAFQWLFCIKLCWFPIARWGSFAHTVLPSLALAIPYAASIARLTMASLKETLSQDYVLAARGKGLSWPRLIARHGAGPILFPVIAYLGPASVHLLMGSFIVEKIFSVPGLGQSMIAGIMARDYPLILGLTILCSFFFLLSTLLAEILCAWIDPRTVKTDV